MWIGGDEVPVERAATPRRRRRRRRRTPPRSGDARPSRRGTAAGRWPASSVLAAGGQDGGEQRAGRRRPATPGGDAAVAADGPRRDGAAAGPGRSAAAPSLVVLVPARSTCTSKPSAWRTIVSTTEPCSSSCQRLRRLAPSTICVAFSERAKSTSAAGDVVADDLAVGAAELARAGAVARRGPGRRGSAGRRTATTWTPIELAVEAPGDARGAADELVAAAARR